ncbi:hypothetical protein K9F62_05760 [Desulfovibrio sp. JY]|nr:hypothetical protein K9F62_05760 [Desulfovibrio sp. JY]
MTVGTDYADDLKRELLTEMADNFFSRRCRLDERLESFVGLREKVARQGRLALSRWLAFRALLRDSPEADRFLEGLGFHPEKLLAIPDKDSIEVHPRHPLALTAAGRYRKAVLAAYDDLRRDLEHYNEGGYAPDPRDPRRMRRIPGYDHLIDTAREINAEIEAVNTCQCPSDMLQFTKSLDPARQEQESTCGYPGDACSLDASLSYTPLDLDALEAPALPTPPPLEEIKDNLANLADSLYRQDPDAAEAALQA